MDEWLISRLMQLTQFQFVVADWLGYDQLEGLSNFEKCTKLSLFLLVTMITRGVRMFSDGIDVLLR